MRIQENVRRMQHSSAVIIGISLIIMAAAAGFSYGYVHSALIVIGEPLTTLQNIQSAFSLFSLGILGWLVVIITDLLVSWAITVYLKPVHREYALLVGWLRLLYTAILAIAVSHLVTAHSIAHKPTALFGESEEMAASQVMLSITSFETIWSWGLILFGLHLLAIGFVAFKTRQIPRYISILAVLAGLSYLLVHLLDTFFPQLEQMTSSLESILMIPMTIGELSLAIWLLIAGRKRIFSN